MNIINIYGTVGVGKSMVLTELDLNRSEIIIVDPKNDKDFQKNFIGAKIICGDLKNNVIENVSVILEELKNEILLKKAKFITIDEFQVFLKKEVLSKFKELMTLIKKIDNEIILILSSQVKIEINDLDIKYFHIQNYGQVLETEIKIDDYIKHIKK